MKKKVIHFYRPIEPGVSELCFNIGMKSGANLSERQFNILRWLLANHNSALNTEESSLSGVIPQAGERLIEIGPLLNFATPFNSNVLSILRNCGFDGKIERVEVSRRLITANVQFDRMTETIYPEPLQSFSTGRKVEEVYDVNLKEKGLAAFDQIEGLSMDLSDKQAYYEYFVGRLNRNPTIVEIMDLNNANSEHSRHGYFKGKQIIDGLEMPYTLMEIVKSTLDANPENSLIAFHDNSSVIRGAKNWLLVPEFPGQASRFVRKLVELGILCTAETHNFPTGVAPYPGAQTGTGGRIRDVQATGRGGLMGVGTVGYAVGNLFLDDYVLPWEKPDVYRPDMAIAKEILIKGSDGTTRYGNEIGEPVYQGFLRACASYLPSGERREWLKPILFTGGVGFIPENNLEKREAKKGMLIIEIGGPAYRIGFGGGAASSLTQGTNKAELDFNAVQRGDAEMEQRVNRVVRACVEKGDNNPIVSIHDQGAGGPANVLKELVEKAGGKIDIRKINSGDETMSVLELWVCEYQERNGLLIEPKDLDEFVLLCERERVPCEVLGEVTGDGIFTVIDSRDGSEPVKLELEAVLGGMPQKTFYSEEIPLQLQPLVLPENLSVRDALERVLRLPSVASKRFLVTKGDRSVSGLVAQQQCCGTMQLPVSDVGVLAQSLLPIDQGAFPGAATSIGEQPTKMLADPEAGARMGITEALTNLACARITDMKHIKCSANWMAAPKLPGEGARMYRSARAMRDFMIQVSMAVDGGKDSLSMATKVEHPDGITRTVKSPQQLVISAYCSMSDVTQVLTPDIKAPGKSHIIHIDLAKGKRRLGGSALAQVYGQVGNVCPDIESALVLVESFKAIQQMIEKKLILSCHDISDGGLIVSLLEMIFAGNCGFTGKCNHKKSEAIAQLFAEEAGWLVECLPEHHNEVFAILEKTGCAISLLGQTLKNKHVVICSNEFWEGDPTATLLEESMLILRGIWEETSFALDKLQSNPQCVKEEANNVFAPFNTPYKLSFTPEPTKPELFSQTIRPKVAIIREEGSNGDREMAAFFEAAGFEAWDVNMYDLINKNVSLAGSRGLAFVGGFSFADVLDSAKGWAATILFNHGVKKMFADFYNRKDTFSLSVCNGCQLAALLDWVPFHDTADEHKVRFIKNTSGRFESRFTNVVIKESPAIMLKGMEGSVLGVWSAHGEGKIHTSKLNYHHIMSNHLAPIRYANEYGAPTESYPFNPNGSHKGIAALCDPTGRHLAMMPHPERSFLKWQMAYMPTEWHRDLAASPWLKMTQNAYEWCQINK